LIENIDWRNGTSETYYEYPKREDAAEENFSMATFLAWTPWNFGSEAERLVVHSRKTYFGLETYFELK
jgi:hypothetical protein